MPQDRGRPEKLTPALQDTLVKAFRLGHFAVTACDLAGIAVSTYHLWLSKGRDQKKGKYRDFMEAVKRASADGSTRALLHIQQDPSWQSKAWFLERRFPELWAAHRPPENDGNLAQETAEILQRMDQVEIDGDGGTDG